MKLIVFTFLILTLISPSIFAQPKSSNTKAYKVDEIIQTAYSGDVKARLFLFSEELAKTEGRTGYIISYKGLVDSQKIFSTEQEKLHRISKFLRLDKSNLIFLNAGFRLNYIVELWIVPKNAEPPKPIKQVEKYDEVGQTAYSEDFKTRLFNIKEKCQNEQSLQLYITNYGTVREKAKRVKLINQALAFAGYDESRVKIVDIGTGKINKTEIWILSTKADSSTSESK